MGDDLATIRRSICQLFWLVLVKSLCCHGKIESCRPIPLADIKAAMLASYDIYTNKVKVGKQIADTSYRVIKVIKPTLKGESLKALVARSGTNTLICFRGTMSERQLFHQFQSAMKPAKRLYYKKGSMRVMQYFWDAFNIFNPEHLVPGGIRAGHKYIVTGHSLGGALASLFSIYMKIKKKDLWLNPNSALITFGAPRVGDKRFAAIHDHLISPDRKLRFVYRYDIVPHLPPSPSYAHHSREIWIWKKPVLGWWFNVHWKTYWRVCKQGDNPSGCSGDMTYAEPFTHHYKYYRRAILAQPDKYYDKYGSSRETFERSQCHLEKRSLT